MLPNLSSGRASILFHQVESVVEMIIKDLISRLSERNRKALCVFTLSACEGEELANLRAGETAR
jgi:hypothetical protein